MLLFGFLFLDLEVCVCFKKIVDVFLNVGILILMFYLMFFVVLIIDFCFFFIGLLVFLLFDVLVWFNSFDLGGGGLIFF